MLKISYCIAIAEWFKSVAYFWAHTLHSSEPQTVIFPS